MIRRVLDRVIGADNERRDFSESGQEDWYRHHKRALTSGQRAADAMRNGMGSWPFVITALCFLAMWVLSDGWGIDVFPWILLNLLLSCVAALQAPIILMAVKRADEVAAALAKHDADVNVEAEKRIEELQARIFVLENEKHDEILRGIDEILRTIR